MKSFKSINYLEKRLKKGICWGDWIKVAGKIYKMVEYGDGMDDNYMMFQNKSSTDIIEIRYQVPCFSKGIQTKFYKFFSLETYKMGYLYRY